jgi:glycosyltransferase involved in cell wall biosynthesis
MSFRPIRVLELRSVTGAGGGPEKTILMGAKLTDPRRIAITVCYLRSAADQHCNIRHRATALGLDYAELVEQGAFDYRAWAALRGLVRARAIDIVHAHDYKTNLLALMLARSEGVVPMTTAHGWTGHSWRERRVYYPLDKRIIRAFPFVVAVSGQIKDDLVRAGVHAERVRVVLNGIDPDAFRRDKSVEAAARVTYGARPGDVVIGAAGRLEPQKRFDLLIRACTQARQMHPSLRLLIAGDGSLRTELETLARELMPGACTILGHQPDIRTLHHALDLYVQSSDYEGTPNAVLEAMALETPIVATAAGGTAEVAEHSAHALIVPTGDATSLVAAMHHVLMHPHEAAARVARARRRVETTLSFANRMSVVDSVYEIAAATRAQRLALAVVDRCA